MNQLIPVINKLQDLFHQVGMLDTLDLPQIAVIGSQSSGKSSVLENLCQHDFLPRGSNIVTRRPLVLQLTQTAPRVKKLTSPRNDNPNKSQVLKKNEEKKIESSEGEKKNEEKKNEEKKIEEKKIEVEEDGEEWGEFLHLPNKKFFDFNEIRNEINRETDRLTGSKVNISPQPIHLRVYSPNVLNLTLIDLPGITKIPVGDQPKDIEFQIKKMCLQFIKNPNCIILAVSAANTDLANSDAIKLASEVDPQGERTLGVLTKVDIMDKGTDAMDMIQGKVVGLKKGFVAVVNRSQKDIQTNKLISEALKDETKFFQDSPSYKGIADKCGTQHLAKKLNNILLNHIKNVLPDIRSKIKDLIMQAKKRMDEYGPPLNEMNMSNSALTLQLLTQFATEYGDSIDGKNVSQISSNELFGGARVNYIFTKKFSPYLQKMDACENLTEYDIRTSIRNAKGPKTSLFIPEESFEMLVKRQVKQLEIPSINCVDQVYDELKTIVQTSEKIILRFPKLKTKVKEFTINKLKDYSKPLKQFIRNLIDIEMAYINTNHPDFFNSGTTTGSLLTEKLKLNQKKNQLPSPNNQNNQVINNNQLNQNSSSLNNKNQNLVQNQNQNQNQQNQNGNGNENLTGSYVDSNPQDKEKMETDLIRTLLTEYFNIVRKNISDSVPKAIMFFLVNKSKNDLQSELVKALYKDELFDDLLKEDDEIAQKRNSTNKMLKVLLKAQDALNEIRDQKF